MSARVYISQGNNEVDAIIATCALGQQFWSRHIEVYNALDTIAFSDTGMTPEKFSDEAARLVMENPLDKVFSAINLRYVDGGLPEDREYDPNIGSTEDKEFIKAVLRTKGLNEEAAYAIKSVHWY